MNSLELVIVTLYNVIYEKAQDATQSQRKSSLFLLFLNIHSISVLAPQTITAVWKMLHAIYIQSNDLSLALF